MNKWLAEMVEGNVSTLHFPDPYTQQDYDDIFRVALKYANGECVSPIPTMNKQSVKFAFSSENCARAFADHVNKLYRYLNFAAWKFVNMKDSSILLRHCDKSRDISDEDVTDFFIAAIEYGNVCSVYYSAIEQGIRVKFESIDSANAFAKDFIK